MTNNADIDRVLSEIQDEMEEAFGKVEESVRENLKEIAEFTQILNDINEEIESMNKSVTEVLNNLEKLKDQKKEEK